MLRGATKADIQAEIEEGLDIHQNPEFQESSDDEEYGDHFEDYSSDGSEAYLSHGYDSEGYSEGNDSESYDSEGYHSEIVDAGEEVSESLDYESEGYETDSDDTRSLDESDAPFGWQDRSSDEVSFDIASRYKAPLPYTHPNRFEAKAIEEDAADALVEQLQRLDLAHQALRQVKDSSFTPRPSADFQALDAKQLAQKYAQMSSKIEKIDSHVSQQLHRARQEATREKRLIDQGKLPRSHPMPKQKAYLSLYTNYMSARPDIDEAAHASSPKTQHSIKTRK